MLHIILYMHIFITFYIMDMNMLCKNVPIDVCFLALSNYVTMLLS